MDLFNPAHLLQVILMHLVDVAAVDGQMSGEVRAAARAQVSADTFGNFAPGFRNEP